MQEKPKKKVFNITLEFTNNMTRTVKIKAIDRSHAERRALKFHPSALGVKRDV